MPESGFGAQFFQNDFSSSAHAGYSAGTNLSKLSHHTWRTVSQMKAKLCRSAEDSWRKYIVQKLLIDRIEKMDLQNKNK